MPQKLDEAYVELTLKNAEEVNRGLAAIERGFTKAADTAKGFDKLLSAVGERIPGVDSLAESLGEAGKQLSKRVVGEGTLASFLSGAASGALAGGVAGAVTGTVGALFSEASKEIKEFFSEAEESAKKAGEAGQAALDRILNASKSLVELKSDLLDADRRKNDTIEEKEERRKEFGDRLPEAIESNIAQQDNLLRQQYDALLEIINDPKATADAKTKASFDIRGVERQQDALAKDALRRRLEQAGLNDIDTRRAGDADFLDEEGEIAIRAARKRNAHQFAQRRNEIADEQALMEQQLNRTQDERDRMFNPRMGDTSGPNRTSQSMGLPEFANALQRSLLDAGKEAERKRQMDEQKKVLDQIEKNQKETNKIIKAMENANIA